MKDAAPTSQDKILQSAYALFFKHGFARVSVDAIAEGANVTKRTVYYHFPSKDDIAAQVLTAQQDLMLQEFAHWVGPDDATPHDKLNNLFAKLQTWTQSPTWLGSGYSRLSMELADLPGHPARKAARTHKRGVEDWLANQLAAGGLGNPGSRARQIMILIEGGMALALIHGDPAYIQAAADAAIALLDDDKK